MEQEWRGIQVNDTIKVIQKSWITSAHLRSLVQLYQPIVATRVTALYTTLWYEIHSDTFSSDWIRLSELLSSLNCSVKEFYEARLKLEGLGLLKTYQISDSEFCYELVPTVLPHQFFKDAILSTMLLEHVGRLRFERLEKQFVIPFQTDNYLEKTAHFSDVFQLPLGVTNFQQSNQELVSEESGISHIATLDIKLVEHLLGNSFKGAFTKEVQQVVEGLHQLYHLSEQELALYIQNAVNPLTQEVDIRSLQEMLIQAHQDQQKNEVQSLQKTQEETPTGTPAEQLIQFAKSVAPFDFIASIKEQKRGFVSNDEQKVLQDLISVSTLPAEVINLLIYYVLVIENNKSLNKKFVDILANDWSQQGIQTAEDVLRYTKERKQTQQQKVMQQPYKRTQGRVEKLPDWAKQENTKVETPLTREQQEILRRKLQQLQEETQ